MEPEMRVDPETGEVFEPPTPWQPGDTLVQVFTFDGEDLCRRTRHLSWQREQESDKDVTEVYWQAPHWCFAIISTIQA
jgi:hypothetical protein